jgi:periplasmic protein TonB
MNLLGWDDGCARWLIQRAARNAPPSLSERLEEEWLADLAAQRGQIARLRFGLGCCWATRVIAHEHFAQKVPAAASATGNKIMTAYAQHDVSFFSRRTSALLLIVALHAALIYAFMAGLGHTMIDVIPQSLQAVVLAPPQTHEPPPPPPEPRFSRPQIDEYVPPDITLEGPTDLDTTIQVVTPQPPDSKLPPATPPKAINRVLGGPGKGFPNTDDYYPSVARRAGEKGVVAVSVCVDAKGRLTAGPTLAQSSGSASLDEGGLKLAKAGSGHYRPTMEDGLPVSSCYAYRIRFDLKD